MTKLRADIADGLQQAIQMKAAALAENPDLIRLTQAESWNGELPATMIPGATIPMLDIR